MRVRVPYGNVRTHIRGCAGHDMFDSNPISGRLYGYHRQIEDGLVYGMDI